MSPVIDPLPSKFLTPPSAQVPLVLLPVRLETRIEKLPTGAMELWLRVYPDDVHVNSFEPALSVEEGAARTRYLALPANVETRKAAFAALARQFGAERAAWITSAEAPAATGQPVPAKAAFTNVLPERWIVLGYQGAGAGEVLTIGPAIADTLAVGPILGTDGKLKTDDTQWVSNFDAAIKAGMGFRIPLTSRTSFRRIVVLGLKTGLSPQESAARLAGLLQAHHYTDGVELLANNTPTNNTEAAASGLTTKDTDYSTLFALEQGPALCPTQPTKDGDRLARALNITPKALAHVNGASGGQDEQANAMNRVLWPATWGYYLGQMVSGTMTNPETAIPAAYDHFVEHVRARGHFPTMRIGSQPYGILPVCWSARWKPLEARPIDAPLHGLLTQLRTIWQRYTGGVPRVPKAADPEAELVELLGMVPSTASTVARNVIGPEYLFMLRNFVKEDLKATWWAELQAKVQQNGSDLAAAMSKTRLAQATYTTWHRELSDVLVAPGPLDGQAAPGFVADLAALGTWEQFRDAVYTGVPATPAPMLFLLLRHAALRFYVDTALDLPSVSSPTTIPTQPSERLDAEMVAFQGTTTPRPSAWDLLLRPYKGSETVGTFLDGARGDASLPVFAAYWKALAQLTTFSARELDAATREVFDLSSYRLDAWITSFAHLRLDQMRTTNPNGGIVLGGYGWVEDVGLWQDELASSGYVHAPSLNQSTTAAILRSGYLSHQGGAGKPFEIDLSSARVRLALHLLDGIREGQSLGALLGYRLERTLQDLAPADGDLFRLIDALRLGYPLEGGAANQLDVVDGLALFRKVTDVATFASAATSSPPLRAALQSALVMLQDALDSVADLALSESVHQLIRGNTLRAGATLDSIARGDTPPLDIDFIKTPRSGTALTYRLMTFAMGDSAPGWTITPRAQAEPRLNAWAAALLGDPAKVRIRTRFVDPAGKVLSSAEIGLNQLGLAAIDLISMPETDGVAGEIADRILRVVANARPASVPADATPEIVTERDPAWPARTIAITEWLGLLNAVTRVTGASRAILPSDLATQGAAKATIDPAELMTRANHADTAMQAALAALKSSGSPDAALLNAAAFGVAGAVPALDPTAWPKQVAVAVAELNARVEALAKLASQFERESASPEDQQDYDTSRLKAVFGASFVVLPLLDAGSSAGWPELWRNTATLQGGDTLASVRWLQRISRVRAGAGLLDTAVMFAEALAGQPLLELEVAQLPANATDRWVALEGAAPGQSTLSLVAFTPTPAVAGSAIAGLMVDEWVEVWPSKDQVTGVSFQYSDPTARAPQAILVAVSPDDSPVWTLEALEGSVLEALDLAKIRGVDPDVLFGDAPPQSLAQNVTTFQSMSDPQAFMVDTEATASSVSLFVLQNTGVLWLNHGPIGDPPLAQVQIDSSVSSFQVLSDNVVVVLRKDGTLWIERGPFGPSTTRQQIDSNVTLVPTLPQAVVIQPPPQVQVPNLVGATQAQVNLRLKGTAWTVKYHLPLPPINVHQVSTVAKQDPPADTPVPHPQEILLTMANISAQ